MNSRYKASLPAKNTNNGSMRGRKIVYRYDEGDIIVDMFSKTSHIILVGAWLFHINHGEPAMNGI
jgi:hypothetical protein